MVNHTLSGSFSQAYLEESRPVLEQYFQRPLSLEEVEGIINSFLELEEVVRKVLGAPQNEGFTSFS